MSFSSTPLDKILEKSDLKKKIKMLQNFEKSNFLKMSKKFPMFFHLSYKPGTFLITFRVSRPKTSDDDQREQWIAPYGLVIYIGFQAHLSRTATEPTTDLVLDIARMPRLAKGHWNGRQRE